MTALQESRNTVQQSLFAVFCLMIICAGGVLVLDRGAGPYHAEQVTQDHAALSGPNPMMDMAEFASIKPRSAMVTPARLLHRLQVDPATDMAGLITRVVNDFDDTPTAKVLRSYLIWAIGARKSDAYVDSLLNSAASKGHFWIPDALMTVSGRLDTPSLLKAVVLTAHQANPGLRSSLFRPSLTWSQHHSLGLSDSLVGLSLAYYGDSMGHVRIADANASVLGLEQAQVGQTIEIPEL